MLLIQILKTACFFLEKNFVMYYNGICGRIYPSVEEGYLGYFIQGNDMERVFSKQQLIKNIWRYVYYFAAMALTALIFKGIFSEKSDLWITRAFDLIGYGQMRPFFAELLTMFFWAMELAAFYVTDVRKRWRARKAEYEQREKPENVEENENDGGRYALKEKNAYIFHKEKTPLLPIRNVVMLTAIVTACILIMSAQIDFHVKPFYDLGEQVQGYDLFNRISAIVRNIVKCIWIVWILHASREVALELCALIKNEAERRGVFVGVYMGLFLLFAMYDVLTSGMSLTVGVTYFVMFYPCFVIVDALAKHSAGKAYVLIMLIYIF